MLAAVGMTDQADKRPDQLSGGQKQRVAVARALVGEPRLVLADEPTANLDHDTAHRILDLMKKMRDDFGTTFVFSTHDPRVMAEAEVTFTLEDGRLARRRARDRAAGGRMIATLKLAARNLSRYRRRTLLTALLITIGVVAMLLFVAAAGSFKQAMIGQITDSMLGHLQVHRRGYVASVDNLPLNLNMPAPMVAKVEEALKDEPAVAAYSIRMKLGAMFSNYTESTSIRLNGIDPKAEDATTPGLRTRIMRRRQDGRPRRAGAGDDSRAARPRHEGEGGRHGGAGGHQQARLGQRQELHGERGPRARHRDPEGATATSTSRMRASCCA